MNIEIFARNGSGINGADIEQAADLTWKDIMRQASGAFDDEEYKTAAELYECAASKAQTVFEDASAAPEERAQRAAPMILAAALNAAQSFNRLNELEDMERIFTSTADLFLAALNTPQTHPLIKEMCVVLLTKLLNEYKSQLRRLKADPARFDFYFRKARDSALIFWTSKKQAE